MPQASIVIDIIKAGLVALPVAAFLFTAAGVVGSLAHMAMRRLTLLKLVHILETNHDTHYRQRQLAVCTTWR